jgi:hypothetical protein
MFEPYAQRLEWGVGVGCLCGTEQDEEEYGGMEYGVRFEGGGSRPKIREMEVVESEGETEGVVR